MSEVIPVITRFAWEIGRVLLTLVLILVLYVVAIAVLDAATNAHWMIGLVAVLVFWVALLLGIQDLKSREAKKFPVKKGLGIYLLEILLGAAVFGALSMILWRAGWAQYTSDGELDYFTFNSYYIWLFLDLLPVLKITSTLDLSAPLESIGVIAGLPIVAYRAFVVYGLLKAFNTWWRERDREEVKPVDTRTKNPRYISSVS